MESGMGLGGFFRRGLLQIVWSFLFVAGPVGAQKIGVAHNVSYFSKESEVSQLSEHKLDVYYPKGSAEGPREVLVFIHGGSWAHGDKKLYTLIGRRMAKQGKVAVVINYRLSPKAKYDDMLYDCAYSINWVSNNISQYNGDPGKILVSGHSAGGHLAACLMVTDIFERMHLKNPIKGCILIDPFGLDLYSYLSTYKTQFDISLYRTFGDQPDNWKKASPYYALKANTVPFLVFVGSQSYPPIINESQRFVNKLNELGCCAEFEMVQGKRHRQMILQMFFRGKPMYDRIIGFMNNVEPQGSTGQLVISQDNKKD